MGSVRQGALALARDPLGTGRMHRAEHAADAADLLAALDRLRDTHRRIGDTIANLEGEGRRALVATRRELADGMAAICARAEAVLPVMFDGEVLGEFRRRFSAMRSAAALHQANWPAVSVTDDIPAYASSAAQVREAHRSFDQWVRDTLGQGASSGGPLSARGP